MKSIVRTSSAFSVTLFLAFLTGTLAHAQTEIDVQVSPNVISVDSNGDMDALATIHAAIPYSAVEIGSVWVIINDVALAPVRLGTDAQGDLVVKFLPEALVADQYNTFELTGSTTNGDSFHGIDDMVYVIAGEPVPAPAQEPEQARNRNRTGK